MIISFKATAKYTPQPTEYVSPAEGTPVDYTEAPRPPGSKKLVVTFDIIKNYTKAETKVFLLPDKQGQFKSTLLKLFDTYSNIMPTNLTKARFKADFIEWTLKQNFATVDVNTINNHYNVLFEVDLRNPLSDQLKKMFEQAKALQGETQQSVDDYKKA